MQERDQMKKDYVFTLVSRLPPLKKNKSFLLGGIFENGIKEGKELRKECLLWGYVG